MLTPEQIIERLKDHKIAAVAKSVNIPYFQIYNFINGNVVNPSYRVVKALSDYLTKDED